MSRLRFTTVLCCAIWGSFASAAAAEPVVVCTVTKDEGSGDQHTVTFDLADWKIVGDSYVFADEKKSSYDTTKRSYKLNRYTGTLEVYVTITSTGGSYFESNWSGSCTAAAEPKF